MQFNHDESNPFCSCAVCEAELEQALQASIVRQAQNEQIARRAARECRIERLEADIVELQREVAALKERLGE